MLFLLVSSTHSSAIEEVKCFSYKVLTPCSYGCKTHGFFDHCYFHLCCTNIYIRLKLHAYNASPKHARLSSTNWCLRLCTAQRHCNMHPKRSCCGTLTYFCTCLHVEVCECSEQRPVVDTDVCDVKSSRQLCQCGGASRHGVV